MDRTHVRPEAQEPLVVAWLTERFSSPRTRRNYSLWIRKLMHYLPDNVHLALATRDDCIAAAHAFDMDCSPGARYWNSVISCWSSFFEYLIDRGKRAENPAAQIRKRREPDTQLPCPSPEEVRLLWRTVNDPQLWETSSRPEKLAILRDRAILALLIACGLRAAELCSLRRKSFDVKTRVLRLQRKGGRERQLPWPKAADDYILPAIDGVPHDGPVFLNGAGRGIDEDYLNKILANICVAAGITPYTAHAFRRYSITDTIEKHGVHIAQAFAQHANISTTMRYDANRFSRQVSAALGDGRDEESQ